MKKATFKAIRIVLEKCDIWLHWLIACVKGAEQTFDDMIDDLEE